MKRTSKYIKAMSIMLSMSLLGGMHANAIGLPEEDFAAVNAAVQEFSPGTNLDVLRDDIRAFSLGDGDNIIHELAAHGRTDELARVLNRLNQGDDDDRAFINQQNNEGYKPLHVAAAKGYTNIVELLLRNPDIDVNALDKERNTPLHEAAARGNTEVIQLLLAHPNFNVDTISAANRAGDRPLHLAAFNGNAAVVAQLLAHPSFDVNTINAADNEGSTPLHFAAIRGATDVVEQLLANEDIKVNLQNKSGHSPLHWAAAFGHAEVVTRLLANENIVVNLQNKRGYSPLHLAEVTCQTFFAEFHKKAPRFLLTYYSKYDTILSNFFIGGPKL